MHVTFRFSGLVLLLVAQSEYVAPPFAMSVPDRNARRGGRPLAAAARFVLTVPPRSEAQSRDLPSSR